MTPVNWLKKYVGDKRLIELYRDGNIQAMGEIIERHYRPLHSFVYVKTRDLPLTEDILQETFIKVILTLKKMDGHYQEQTTKSRL